MSMLKLENGVWPFDDGSTPPGEQNEFVPATVLSAQLKKAPAEMAAGLFAATQVRVFDLGLIYAPGRSA